MYQSHGENSPLRPNKMDDLDNPELPEEEQRERIPKKCTVGRVINICIIIDLLLIVLTALIVSGSLGTVNTRLRDYPDNSGNTGQICVLYSSKTCNTTTGVCSFVYGRGGSCGFAEATFGIIAAIVVFYIVISIVRIVFAFDIGLTVIVDNLVILVCGFFAFVVGITISIGFSITCNNIKEIQIQCDSQIPNHGTGYKFYHQVNVSQATAWLCFLFLFVAQVIFIGRAIVFFTRCRRTQSQDDSEILTADDHLEEDSPKPV